jgi:methylglutaconyl-CoA hydratase
MSYSTLQIERRGAVATLWMNRPDKHNAFNEALIGELTAALDTQEGARVVVLGGRGKSFSAGADLDWMRRQGEASEADNLKDARAAAGLFRKLAELCVPTIARVHGAAIGGGMGLAAACDICVASTDATFATSEVRFGLVPAVISPYVIRAIGARQAYRYFQTGERIDAVRARELGLVHEVAAPNQLDAAVQSLIDALLLGGPEALATATSLIRVNRPVPAELIEETARRIAQIRAGDEAREGLAAFLTKRKPSWQT